MATYAPQLQRSDAQIDWSRPAVDIWRAVRAYNPWPVAHTTYAGQELRILEAWPADGQSGSLAIGQPTPAPGTVLAPSKVTLASGPGEIETFSVQTGDGALAVLRLQKPGGKPMSGLDFIRGQRDFIGARLGV
jgi:methionyl-tRNA formyltransferase